MRTCMYCGRELEKGEACTCSASRARRGETEDNSNPYRTETSYKTGYAGSDNRFERARDKYRAKREAKKNSPRKSGFFRDLWQFCVKAIKNPSDAVSNPAHIGMWAMVTISAVMGALLWLCIFFIMRGGAVGPFALIASALSFSGTEGYRLLASIGLCILSGAIGGVVMFFLYTGIFYFINRFIMRLKTKYSEFCIRLVTAWVPFSLFCLAGAVISILSPYTLIAILAAGAAISAALTYEALKTEWYSVPPSKVIWGMVLGYFVFFSIMVHLLMIH